MELTHKPKACITFAVAKRGAPHNVELRNKNLFLVVPPEGVRGESVIAIPPVGVRGVAT